MITEKELEDLLASTDALFSNIHCFSCKPIKRPGKSHTGAAVTYQDIKDRSEDFARELRNSMCSWVYSKKKYREIFDTELKSRNLDVQNAASHIQSLVAEKFRAGFPNGQFGELLLFNFIQHIFKAPPLLRKMPLTTNPAIERHGADAIHYRPLRPNGHLVLLGEAKTYTSKYKFNVALADAIESVLASFNNFQNELGLYVLDDFVDESLRDAANGIKNNKLAGVKYELVCVVSYSETESNDGPDEAAIKQAIQDIVDSRMSSFPTDSLSGSVNVLSRIHYIVMPFWDLDKILEKFGGV